MAAKAREFVISAEGDLENEIDDPADHRKWLIQNAPTAKFVVLAPNAGSWEWIKIVFTDHVEATAHMVQ